MRGENCRFGFSQWLDKSDPENRIHLDGLNIGLFGECAELGAGASDTAAEVKFTALPD